MVNRVRISYFKHWVGRWEINVPAFIWNDALFQFISNSHSQPVTQFAVVQCINYSEDLPSGEC